MSESSATWTSKLWKTHVFHYAPPAPTPQPARKPKTPSRCIVRFCENKDNLWQNTLALSTTAKKAPLKVPCGK